MLALLIPLAVDNSGMVASVNRYALHRLSVNPKGAVEDFAHHLGRFILANERGGRFPMTQRIAIYWHNGRCLGHTVRCLALGQALLSQPLDITVVGITGASCMISRSIFIQA